jgi:hypothetical protein
VAGTPRLRESPTPLAGRCGRKTILIGPWMIMPRTHPPKVFRFTFLFIYLNLFAMFAVISDIHSNLEALTTVLADIERRGIKTIYCLGDVVGYGPNPKECLDLIIEKTK